MSSIRSWFSNPKRVNRADEKRKRLEPRTEAPPPSPTASPGSSDHGPSDSGSSHHGSSRHGSSHYGSSHYGSSHYGSSHYGSTGYGSSHYGSSDYGQSDYRSSEDGPSNYGPADYALSRPSSPIPTPTADTNYPQEVREYWAQKAAAEKAERDADAAERQREKLQYCPEEVERLQGVRAAAEIRQGRVRVEAQRAEYKKNRRGVGKKIIDRLKDGYGEVKSAGKTWWRKNMLE